MTELETLERAKMYMEKLANGINPIDGSVIPDEDVVNNVRLSRCFFYVADVLRQVIDNGGVTPQKKQKKEPFALPVEKRSAFQFSDTPIPISEVTNRINALIDEETMKKLSYSAIRDWLISLNMLEDALNGEGKTVKSPTGRGEHVGINREARMGQNGPYFVVVYNRAAQSFIMDNLDAIVEHQNTVSENQGTAWSPEHDYCLLDLHQKGVPVREIAVTLKRNSGAVRARLKKLGVVV